MKIKKNKYYGILVFRNQFRGNHDDTDPLEDGSFEVSIYNNRYDNDVEHVNIKRMIVREWKLPLRFDNRYRERGWSGEVQEL